MNVRKRGKQNEGSFEPFFKDLFNCFEDSIGFFGAVDILDQVFGPIILNDGHCGGQVGVEPLLQGLQVVVGSARTCGAPIQTPFHAGLLIAFEEQDELDVGLAVANFPLPALKVVLVSRESVDEEVVLWGLGHCPHQQRARDLHGHDRAVADVGLDQLPVFGGWVLTFSA